MPKDQTPKPTEAELDPSSDSSSDGSPSSPDAGEQPTTPDAPSAESPTGSTSDDAPSEDAPVTHGLGDGDQTGGAGQPVLDPSTNAPTGVVTPGGDAGADEPANPAPFDPTGGANAGGAVGA